MRFPAASTTGWTSASTSSSPPANTVLVDYSLDNHGFRSLNDASINILVTPNNGDPEAEQWTPLVDLTVGETVNGTLTFTFPNGSITDATAIVIGAGWDEDSSGS